MINNFIKTDVSGLVIDPISGGIINTDNKKLEEYKKQKKYSSKINESFIKIEKLEKEMAEFKKILEMLLKDKK